MAMIIPETLPAEGLDIPLRAAFLVLRPFPLLAVAHNNAAPVLTLFPTHLEYRVLTRARRDYADLDLIDVRQVLRTQSVLIGARGRFLAFSGTVHGEDTLTALVGFFARRGLPLSERASALLRRFGA
jgi:hypothetical protein